MVFQSNPGSGAFRSASIELASPSQYDSSEYQPIFPHGRPNHEELISKTSPKPNFRVDPSPRGAPHSRDSSMGFQSYVWDSILMYGILVLSIRILGLCIGFQSHVRDSSLMYGILVLCVGFEAYVWDSNLMCGILVLSKNNSLNPRRDLMDVQRLDRDQIENEIDITTK